MRDLYIKRNTEASRPGLTFWSRGRFDARSLRQRQAGAPYRGR